MPVTAAQFDIEEGLIELPASPARWIWAFTCRNDLCPCGTGKKFKKCCGAA